MSKKELTIREAGKLGGEARAKKYTKDDFIKWGKKGGRPKKANKNGEKLSTV